MGNTCAGVASKESRDGFAGAGSVASARSLGSTMANSSAADSRSPPVSPKHLVGMNPFKSLAEKNRKRSAAHRVVVERLYKQVPLQNLSPGLLSALGCTAWDPSSNGDEVTPVSTPACSPPLAHDARLNPLATSAADECSTTDEMTSSTSGAHLGSSVAVQLLSTQLTDGALSPPSTELHSQLLHRRRTSGRALSSNQQLYADGLRDVRQLTHRTPVVFVVAPPAEASGSVHGQLSMQGCAAASTAPSALATWQLRNMLPSILLHRNAGTSPALSELAGASLATSQQGSESSSPTVQRYGSCTIKRQLHVSPRCVGLLTEDAQRQVMRGKADNAHFIEDVHFVRDT